ncbi:MAG: hypothetical protein AAF478_05525 [Pseudomonadota bacterium]
MKVEIKPVEKKQGLVFKATLHGIELFVQFSDEEKAIIAERKLGRTILMERGAPADTDPDKMARRGLATKIAMSAIKGDLDANNYHITFNKLLKGPDTFWFETPIEAKNYVAELKEDILPMTKGYLEANRETTDADSFEL